MASLEININQVNADFKNIKDAIVNNGVEVTDGTRTADYANKINDVYEAGKKSQYDEFWDSVQQNGNKVDYTHCFYRWGGEYLHPKYKVIPKSMEVNDGGGLTYEARYYNMVYGCPNLKRIEKKYFDLSQYENEKGYMTQSTYGNYYTFAANARLEVIEDVGMQPYYYYSTFRWCPKLHTIEVVRSNEKTIFDQQVFHSCHELQNITIEGVIASNISFHTNGKLTKESIESIVTHLSDTQGATLTLKKQAVDNAFGAEEGVVGSASNEWLDLIKTKANTITGGDSNIDKDPDHGLWTIALV